MVYCLPRRARDNPKQACAHREGGRERDQVLHHRGERQERVVQQVEPTDVLTEHPEHTSTIYMESDVL